jgi:hypothetical protein
MTRALRIVVLGYIVRGPLGGIAWHHLQYAMGLSRLGHDVFFFEDSDDYPSCYDPARDVTDSDPSYGLAFASQAFNRIGLGQRWAYFDAHRSSWTGPAASSAPEICRTADVVLNLSGVNPLRACFDHVAVRVLVDTDPVFTQIRHLTNPVARARAADHTAFLSFAENIGQPDCGVPADGFPWQPTRQPVVMDAWTPTPAPADGPLTTVMLWDSYPAAEHLGTRYGMKSDSFAPYLDLPTGCTDAMEIAIGCPAAVRERLVANGWAIVDPRQPTRDPWTYQEYIARSKAEFSVAKQGYVVSRSGWFSERSTAYLASGRPVVVQDTGFSRWLDAPGGVLPFTDPIEALSQLDALNREYTKHCADARTVAGDYFGAPHVLTSLLERAAAQRRTHAAAGGVPRVSRDTAPGAHGVTRP